MNTFSLTNTHPLVLRFEKLIERAANRGFAEVDVVGTDSSLAIALFLTQLHGSVLSEHAHLVVVPTGQQADQLARHIAFFDPNAEVISLPGFDVSPFSGLYPNARIASGRVAWLHCAQHARPRQIFIAPIDAFLQRAPPVSVVASHTFSYRVGDDLPSDLSRLLGRLGYQSTPLVEDVGTFAIRGGIIDLWSPAHREPIRIELFGDSIESLRSFNAETQRSGEVTQQLTILPPREILFDDENRQRAANRFRQNVSSRPVDDTDRDAIMTSLIKGQWFPGLDFLIGDFYEEFALPLDHFKDRICVWMVNQIEITREADVLLERIKREHAESETHCLRPDPQDLFKPYDSVSRARFARALNFSKIQVEDHPFEESNSDQCISVPSMELKFPLPATAGDGFQIEMLNKVAAWRAAGYFVVVAAGTQAQCQRLAALFEKSDLSTKISASDDYGLALWIDEQSSDANLVHILPRPLGESLRLTDERLIFLRDEDFFGRKQRRRDHGKSGTLEQRTNALSFTDLKPGDAVVHVNHGIGIFEGLTVMQLSGVAAELITISYKDGDKLYLPIYRIGQIQKYSGPVGQHLVDKLGGTQWQKTTARVRNHLRDIASELLALYAKRSQIHRPAFPADDSEFSKFEAFFPYDETNDQLRAVDDIVRDMTSDRPMDRLVCGDVGFGKTEVAMRAAFKTIEGKRQVAVLAPTTVLSFQHLETFQRRFKNWPVVIRALNRFVPSAEIKQTLEDLRLGKVDIVVGTHRLLSKDIVFKDLGLLIIDEEQRFGVTHKERMKKMKSAVDTLTLSATPIPRTLNMSLAGMRDLSIINTPPVDRLPTRTFVTKFDKETIGKAISAEIQRGGQVFFLHNRVQSIYSVADELRQIVPQARIRVGHGQMDEGELENVMVAFYHHQVDVLVCTTIIEAGIDNPRANTMFIDNAHQFGLAQLYQLRGRVGRSKERAYCYLLIPANRRIEPDAQERLKIIQENTELGSGIRIAHHDLELRGAGNLLGEDQSGHIDAVGYEMYLELLENAIRELKGEEVHEDLEPEINVRIPALIPDSYMPDIRIRLSYYKALSGIKSPDDIERIEEQMTDQFGKLPEQVTNLMGLMLIRHHCRELGIRDLSSGPRTLSLAFTERTPLPPQKVVKLAQFEGQKYSLTPDMRLLIRFENLSWPNIYDELLFLKRVCDPAFQVGPKDAASSPRQSAPPKGPAAARNARLAEEKTLAKAKSPFPDSSKERDPKPYKPRR